MAEDDPSSRTGQLPVPQCGRWLPHETLTVRDDPVPLTEERSIAMHSDAPSIKIDQSMPRSRFVRVCRRWATPGPGNTPMSGRGLRDPSSRRPCVRCAACALWFAFALLRCDLAGLNLTSLVKIRQWEQLQFLNVTSLQVMLLKKKKLLSSPSPPRLLLLHPEKESRPLPLFFSSSST